MGQLRVERRDGGGNVEMPQGTAIEIVTVLKTVGRHEDANYVARQARGVRVGGSFLKIWTKGA